jgi:hypothetical protein
MQPTAARGDSGAFFQIIRPSRFCHKQSSFRPWSLQVSNLCPGHPISRLRKGDRTDWQEPAHAAFTREQEGSLRIEREHG